MEYKTVEGLFIIVSPMLMIKYLTIILWGVLTKRSHRSMICSQFAIIYMLLESIMLSRAVIFHSYTLIVFSLSSMLIIRSHISVM